MLQFIVPILAATSAAKLHTTADLLRLPEDEYEQHHAFCMTGTVVTPINGTDFIFADTTGRALLWEAPRRLSAGDFIRLHGHTAVDAECLGFFKADEVSILGMASVPPPLDIDLSELADERYEFAVIRTQGIVTDARIDEIDPAWSYLVIRSGKDTAYAFILNEKMTGSLDKLLFSKVSLTGVCIPKQGGLRIFIGPHILIRDANDIIIVSPSPEDPFQAPLLKDFHHVSAASIATMGSCRTKGRVIATWDRNRMLLNIGDRRIIGVETAEGTGLPSCTAEIEAVGFPETDLFRINLSHVRWRQTASTDTTMPEIDTPREIDLSKNILPRFWPENHGRLLRLEGTVRNLPAPGNASGRINLSCGNYLIPVDISSCPRIVSNLEIGCRIRVDGICVTDVPNWQSNAAFPHMRGFFLVVRKAEDIVVLSRPSWWTPGRLLAVIGSLLAALVSIFIWNIALRRVAERRGRELFKAEIGKVGAELRIDERTRLAVDLHDSLAQNLTAVSFQVASAMSARAVAPAAADEHLKNADRMLRSCRTELRRCLWDLRSDTLEERDFGQVIRTTVEPVQGDAALHVRFNVPRARVSDTTAHAVLNIIRELVSNAVRHGRARNVWIAGEVAQRQLRFSVRDDGTHTRKKWRGVDEG